MKMQWMTAALLGSALLVGCGDRRAETPQNREESQAQAPAAGEQAADQVNPATPAAPPPSSSAEVDTASPATTTGSRASRSARAATTRPAPSRVPQTSANAHEQHGDITRNVEPAESRSVPTIAPRPTWREVTIPAGTALPLELTTRVSSETSQVETPVRARLRQAVVIDGTTAIPAGATLVGEVAEVERAGRVQGRARLVLRFNEVQMDGGSEPLRTNPIVFQGEATRGEDATKIGVGAGVGAAIGGILGGGDGAAKGAAIGGAAGAGTVLATRGREVTLASGADINATLASPIEVRVPAR